MTTLQATTIKDSHFSLLTNPRNRLKEIAIAPKAEKYLDEFFVLFKTFGLEKAERFFFAKVKSFEVYLISEENEFISLTDFFLNHTKATEVQSLSALK